MEAWGSATLEERHQLLSMMLDAVYVDMTQGLVIGLKPKPEFLPLFNLGEPVTTGDAELVTGGMEQGLTMIMLLIGLGTFLNNNQPLLTSAALETTGREVATATLGFMSFSRVILAAVAPPIGSIFYNISPDQVFIYIAVLFAIAIVILIITPIPKPQKK